MDKKTATQMIGGNPNGKRAESDFYPTPPEVTIALLDFLRLPLYTLIWEPACGEGDMLREIRRYGYYCFGTDLRTGYDFISNPIPEDHGFLRNDGIAQPDFIITNPPFSTSEDFIRHALDLSIPFAFLLKSQYWHAARRADLFEECPPEYILPLTWRPDFLFKQEGKHSPLMDVMWCVWMRSGGPTIYQPLRRPNV